MKPLHLLALTLYDFTRGTIWKVREAIWKETLGKKYDQKSTKVFHFGLSIRKKQPQSLHEMVPILHGTSGESGKVVARGLSRKGGDLYATSFRHIGPSSFRTGTVFQGDKILPAEKPEGYWYEHNPVVKNHWKPNLNEEEQGQLISFLKRRKLD